MKTLALVPIPQATVSVVKPKPTRAEVIDAMTALKMQQISKERQALQKKHEALEKLIDKLAVRTLKKSLSSHKPSVRTYSYQSGGASCSINFELSPIPPELVQMIHEKENLKSSIYKLNKNEKDVRKEIARGMANIAPRADRVDALLTDKASRRALEAALEKLAA